MSKYSSDRACNISFRFLFLNALQKLMFSDVFLLLQEHFQKLRIENSMGSLAPTSKQVANSFLVLLQFLIAIMSPYLKEKKIINLDSPHFCWNVDRFSKKFGLHWSPCITSPCFSFDWTIQIIMTREVCELAECWPQGKELPKVSLYVFSKCRCCSTFAYIYYNCGVFQPLLGY